MACYRNNSSFKRNPQSQRGRGVGNILRSLYNKVTPTIKSFGSKVLASPVTKTALTTVKDIAANTGLTILKDTLRGEDLATSTRSNVSVAKRKLSKALLDQLYRQTGRGRKKRRLTDSDKRGGKRRKIEFLFDDDSVVID